MQKHKKQESAVNINYTGAFEQEGPDYLKIDTTNMKHNPLSSTLETPGGTTKNKAEQTNVSIISRTNGWLTVDSRTLNRKQAFERHVSGSNMLNNKETSPLSPDWMQRVNLLAHKARNDVSHTELQKKNVGGK